MYMWNNNKIEGVYKKNKRIKKSFLLYKFNSSMSDHDESAYVLNKPTDFSCWFVLLPPVNKGLTMQYTCSSF